MEAPGEKLVIRLWETIADKGIGGLLAPWQIRRKKRAEIDSERQEVLALAQAEKHAEDIRAGRKVLDVHERLVDAPPQGSPLSESIDSDKSVATIAGRNRIARDLRAEVNTTRALLVAEATLENGHQAPPKQTVDDDWLFRWREAASMVSSRELQELWGRALAGEIKAPGSCSLRTLEFLKNLSHGEAQQIAKLAPFVIDSDLVVREPQTDEVLQDAGIADGFLLGLEALGIVSGFGGLGWRKTYSSESPNPPAKFRRALVAYDRILLVNHNDPTKAFRLEGCFVTSLGDQILQLGSFKPHEDYLRAVGRAIADKGFTVGLARFERVDSAGLRPIEPVEMVR